MYRSCHSLWIVLLLFAVTGGSNAGDQARVSPALRDESRAETAPLWEHFGPGGGGWIEDVVEHPTNPLELWCMTDLSGLYQSTDAGITWRKRSGPVERGILARKMIASHNRQFCIDPNDPRHMYWGVAQMIWASHDGGETWSAVYGDAPTFGDDKTPHLGMAVTVGRNGAVFAYGQDGMLRTSRDHGQSWQDVARPPIKTNHATDPAFPLAAPDGTLYLTGRSPEGLAVSRDDGRTWQVMLPGQTIVNMKYPSGGKERPATLFALSADGRVYRTDDGGRAFTQVTRVRHRWSPGSRFAGGLAVAPDGAVLVWAAEEQVRSTNWGQTWQPLDINHDWRMGSYAGRNRWSGPQGKCSNLAVSCDGRTWLKCDSSLVARSVDGGASWTGATEGIHVLCYFQSPAFSRQDPNVAMVAALDQGVFVTRDGGKTWEALQIDSRYRDAAWRNHDGSVVRQHPTRADTWFAVVHGHDGPRQPRLFQSNDGGKSWSLILDIGAQFGGVWDKYLSDNEITDLAFDPQNPDIMHVSNYQLGVITSRDGGRTWKQVLQTTNGTSLVVSPSGRHVYLQCQKQHGLYGSHDRGLSWSLVKRADGIDGLAHHPQDDNTLYVTTGQHENWWSRKGRRPGVLLKSTDSGANWEQLAALDGGALYVDPFRPDVMLMSTLAEGRGILRSVDGGHTWHAFHADSITYTCRGFGFGGKPGTVALYNFGNLALCRDLYGPRQNEPPLE
jgi:photosystem II stability/assembly factor-like uncharacterized protein